MKNVYVRSTMALGMMIAVASAEPVGTAFTVQGRVTIAGAGPYGIYDLRFSLFDAPTGGNLVAGPITHDGTGGNPGPVLLANGQFSAKLDFGPVFDGTALWLHIELRQHGAGNYLVSSPRQPLAVTPFALWAENGTVWTQDNGSISYFGDVGIGTADPLANLHVYGDGTQSTVRITNGPSCGEMTNTGLYIGEVCGSGTAALFFGNSTNAVTRMINHGTGHAAAMEGDVSITGEVSITGGTDVEPVSGGFLSLGSLGDTNIAIDDNEIMARDNGVPATLFLNAGGGDTSFGGFINIAYQIVEILNENAACPAGTNIVGGGCRINGDAEIRGSYPLNNQWVCEPGDQVGFIMITSYAICAGIK